MASCKPANCRRSILLFLFIFGTLQFLLMSLSSIFRSTLTFVEKQFNIDSKTSGFITSGNEMASLVLILPVTYFGCRFHRPLCIAIGGLVVTAAYVCLGLPHFFMPNLQIDKPANDTTSPNATELCPSDSSAAAALIDDVSATPAPLPPSTTPVPAGEPNRLWVMLFLAQLLVGFGSTHIYSYGASYVDDYAGKARSPLYFGILMALNLLGPGFGHVFGAWTSGVWVDADRMKAPIGPHDPRFVGAWWLGPILMSIFVGVTSTALFIFPKKMNSELEQDLSPLVVSESVNHFTINDGGDTKKKLVQLKFWDFVKAFPKVTLRLFTNPVFTLSVLCFGFVMAMVAALAVFQPKYMQEEFGITSAHANFLIGAFKMPFGIVGTLCGGAIMGRLKLNIRGASLMVLTLALLSAVCLLANFFIGCETRRVGGVNVGLNASCSIGCKCDSRVFDPVCGDDGVEYFSPCQAGCSAEFQQNTTENGFKKFGDCKCVRAEYGEPGLQKVYGPGAGLPTLDAGLPTLDAGLPSQHGRSPGLNLFRVGADVRGNATAGSCKNSACVKKAYTYTGIGALSLFLSGLLQAPTIMILLRSIAVEDKSFGLGIMMLCGRLLGWIPIPPLTGALIDSTCLKWAGASQAGAKKGACRLYDATALRNSYWGLLIGLDLTVVVLFAVIAFYVHTKKFAQDNNNNSKSKTAT